MTEINISYDKLSESKSAKCQISIANSGVSDLLLHFQRLFGKELATAEISQKGERTTILFHTSIAKIKLLEKTILLAKQMTARLN